jgi:hypothetical protein
VLFKENRAMEPFAPVENGRPVKIGGFFVRANDINTIMLSVARNDSDTRKVIFHEAVHWHLSAREGFMPLWLAEGLAEVYATFEMSKAKTYAFGAEFEAHVARLREDSLLPLPKLVGIGRDSLLYNEGTRTSIFYAQSWAIVHFLYFGQNSPGRAAVHRYLELLPVVRSPDDAFLTAFGADYATLEQQLRRYVSTVATTNMFTTIHTDDVAPAVEGDAAAQADIELAQGSLLLGARSPEDAEPYLGRAANLAPSDARAWELLGHVAVRRWDFATALVMLTRQFAAGSTVISFITTWRSRVCRSSRSHGCRIHRSIRTCSTPRRPISGKRFSCRRRTFSRTRDWRESCGEWRHLCRGSRTARAWTRTVTGQPDARGGYRRSGGAVWGG